MRLRKKRVEQVPLDEHDDDAPVGQILSRREMLKVLAGAGAALTVGYGATQANSLALGKSLSEGAIGAEGSAGVAPGSGATTHIMRIPSCVVRPAFTEGPFFVDQQLNRSDIRIDTSTGQISDGAVLRLTFNVSLISGGCAPLPGAQVDVWQCDAYGRYSGVGQYVGRNWLRGYQYTDQNGVASFITIYPGWYPGRTVHIHFKVRIGNYTFTSQLFFDDLLTDQVFTQWPYNLRGPRDTRNANDGIYQNGGSQMLLNVVPDGQGGYMTTFDIGLAIAGATPIPTAMATATVTRMATATATSTNTAVPTNTSAPANTPTSVSTAQPTSTANPTNTAQPTSTTEPCLVTFSDVNRGDYFYDAVMYLACNGVVSGYIDGTFRPYNNATRAQFVKMIVLSQRWTLLNPGTPTFRDVPRDNTFYQYIETAVDHGIISGYADATFRPNNEVTRGQVCKIIALAHGWPLLNPATPRFSDVPRDHAFYQYIETVAVRGVVGGYNDGTFRGQNSATRGQIAKMIHQALFG